jgi:hypothetical protein
VKPAAPQVTNKNRYGGVKIRENSQILLQTMKESTTNNTVYK